VLSARAVHVAAGRDAAMDPEVIGQLVASGAAHGALVTMDVLRNGDRRSLDALGPVLRHTVLVLSQREQLHRARGVH